MTRNKSDSGRPKGEEHATDNERQTLIAMHERSISSYEALASRMQSVNLRCLTANSIMFAGTGVVIQADGIEDPLRGLLLFYFGVIGVAICLSWLIHICSFEKLSATKFRVTRKIEERLGSGFRSDEARIIGSWKELLKRYGVVDGSMLMPLLFGILQGLITTYGLISIFSPDLFPWS